MNRTCDDALYNLGLAFFNLGLWLLRSSRYLVLLLGLGLVIGGAYSLALSNPIGWLFGFTGLTVTGLNLFTWNLVRKFTSERDDGG